jgi:hypothetical protein
MIGAGNLVLWAVQVGRRHEVLTTAATATTRGGSYSTAIASRSPRPAGAWGLTASALHFRILARTHDEGYGEVDLRAIGADMARRRMRTCPA